MASITNTTLSSITALLGNNTTAKSAAKNTLTSQSTQLANSLLGTTDTSNLSAAADAMIQRTHNKIDIRRKALTQQGESVLIASDLLTKAGTGSNNAITALNALRALAQEAAKPETTAARRAELQTSFTEQLASLSKTVNDTQRDGKQLLTGTFGAQTINVGTATARQTIRLDFPDLTTRSLGLDALTLDSTDSADAALARIDGALRTATNGHTRLQQQAERLGKASDTLINTLTQITSLQNSLDATLAAQRANTASQNSNDLLSAFYPNTSGSTDLLSTFYPSNSLRSSAQFLL